jgi:hypothetical protein
VNLVRQVTGTNGDEEVTSIHITPPDKHLVVQCARLLPESSGSSLCFDVVALGGTFDHLHAGHRLLLASAALIATKKLYIGITGVASFDMLCVEVFKILTCPRNLGVMYHQMQLGNMNLWGVTCQ